MSRNSQGNLYEGEFKSDNKVIGAKRKIMKGKPKRMGSATDIVYQKELRAIKFKFSMEEEVLM